jgi:integrase
VDFVSGQLSLSHSLHLKKGGTYEFRHAKTTKSDRAITFIPISLAALREHYEYCKQTFKLLDTLMEGKTLIFCHFDISKIGKHLTLDIITRTWSDIANNAGLRHIRLHDACHTHASILLKQAVHPKII